MKDQPKGIKSENSSKLISQRSTKDLYHVPKKENFKKKKTDSNNTTIKKLDK